MERGMMRRRDEKEGEGNYERKEVLEGKSGMRSWLYVTVGK